MVFISVLLYKGIATCYGHAIAKCDEYANVIEIQLEDITPLTEKLKQKQQQQISST